MGMVAFLPRQDWLVGSRLAPVFLTAAHGGANVVPIDLGQEIRQGLEALRMAQPNWWRPSSEIHWRQNTNPAVERVGKGKRFS
jgi:membrane protein required for colicin V production